MFGGRFKNWINDLNNDRRRQSVLRIQFILMRFRIRILDPHWKKMDPDPDPEYFLKFTEFF